VQELLPWYVTGRLEADEQARVRAHVETCAECQAEVRMEERLEAEVARLPLDVERGWADMRARLAVEAAPARRLRVPMTWLGWAVAASLAATIGVISLPKVGPQAEPGAYHALGAAPAAAGNVVVVFLPETTERRMREVLKASEARLVDGPTAANGYVLRVAPARRTAALAMLRADKAVVVAEPLDAGGAR
jgi:anti-sigma factor RsiW